MPIRAFHSSLQELLESLWPNPLDWRSASSPQRNCAIDHLFRNMQPTQVTPQTVMVVDDEPLVRNLFHDLLTGRCRLLQFVNGADAIQWCVKNPANPVDLVICDFAMPGFNGAETFQHILRMRPGVKSILMSGTIVEEVERVALENRFDRWIIKPFPISLLRQMIDELLIAAKRKSDTKRLL